MPKNEQFAKALKALRATTGLSQPDFAQFVGLRDNVIRDWEQAHALPSFEKFINLLRKLGPDGEYLLKAILIQEEMIEPTPEQSPAARRLALDIEVKQEKKSQWPESTIVKGRTRK